MAAVIAGLKSVDFYRKLKKDLQQVRGAEYTSPCAHRSLRPAPCAPRFAPRPAFSSTWSERAYVYEEREACRCR